VIGNQFSGGRVASILRVEVHNHGEIFSAFLPTRNVPEEYFEVFRAEKSK
jgi:hypothetical protein